MIDIPNFKTLTITHIVCDYNGTIATDGRVQSRVKALFEKLSKTYKIHVITADTFGSVHKELEDYPVTIKVLKSSNHTQEKADYIESLDAIESIAIGNGNNDALMLKEAVIGIALLGDEGCAGTTLINADIVCKSIENALELFLYPKRLIATLRK